MTTAAWASRQSFVRWFPIHAEIPNAAAPKRPLSVSSL